MAAGGQINTDTLSDEIFDVSCSMCKNQGKNADGEKYCVDCKDYFCVTCIKVHSKVPLCAGHKVLDRSQVKSKSGNSKGLLNAPTERCDRHSHKHIDMYCQNHDNVGCSTCMADDHRLCKDTFYIQEFIKKNSYKVKSTGVKTKIKKLAKTLDKQSDRFKQDKQRLLKRKAEILIDLRKCRQEINDHLDKLEKSSVDEIESKFKSLQDKVEDGLKQLQMKKSRITSAFDKLASQNTNKVEVFVHVKMAEDAANVAYKYIEDAKLKSTVEDLEFHFDRTILTSLEQKKTLGTPKKTLGTPKKTQRTQPEKPIGNSLQIKSEKSFNVKVKSDEDDCNITSACCMEDGTIILADQSNNKLKRIHRKKYTVTEYCDLPGEPHQVCMINNTQVAVTVPSQMQVHFISVEKKIKTKDKIHTDFKCYGLAYANSNLYISDFYTSVYMYTLSGRKLIQFSAGNPGHELCPNIYSLAVSKNATRIYVADLKNGLIVLDNNGQVITSLNDSQMSGAQCCCLIEAGSVLVSGYYSNNVSQFTSGGELKGEVIKADSGKEDILSVCCNQQMTMMCVSREYDNIIEVYDI